MSKYPNSGIISKNKFKKDGDKKPDYTGHCEVGGVKYEVAVWKNSNDEGPFFTLKFQEPRQKQAGDSDHAPRSKFDDL
jgi:hypothetical protein